MRMLSERKPWSRPDDVTLEGAGGGVALVRAISQITGLEGDNEDQNIGIAAALRAMEGPLRQIVDNAGDEASVVLDKVRQGEGNFGYNAASGDYGDMIEMGILDPAKVTRAALQAAGSVAGLMITTEVMIAEHPHDIVLRQWLPSTWQLGEDISTRDVAKLTQYPHALHIRQVASTG